MNFITFLILIWTVDTINYSAKPWVLREKGTVVVGTKDDPRTKGLVSFMNQNNIDHRVEYVENNAQLKRYINNDFSENKPLVFKDGSFVGDDVSYKADNAT